MNTSPTSKKQTAPTVYPRADMRPAGPWANGWVPVWAPTTFTVRTDAKASFTPARTTGRTHG